MTDEPNPSQRLHDLFRGAFPLGSHLCREPMPPMSELKRDMENLKRHGFNMVKLQEHWAIDEPREGHYDFSRYEELIAHAKALDMVVYLGLTCEQAPSWLWRKHPGCRMVGREGLPVAYEAQATYPADGKPGPCFDHDGARADQDRFITKLVETLGHYPRIIWNTWQEIGTWGQSILGQDVCYCEHTLSFFRSWLQGRYADLDRLNRAWNTRYLDWDDIAPEGRAGKSYLALEVDWRYFLDNVRIARILQGRAEVIRAADPLARPVFAHVGWPTLASARDWAYARCQDFLGSSCYPAWNPLRGWDDDAPAPGRPVPQHPALLAEMCSALGLQYDYLRSCSQPGHPVWAAEFQGGPVSDGFHLGRIPSAADLRRWILTAVGSGVTGISFWVTRAEIGATEANGFSLLDSEGDTNERFEEAARVGRALNRQADLFAQPSSPAAPIGILIEESNYGSSVCMNRGGEHLPYSVRGWHRLLWEAGLAADFVNLSEAEPDALSRYRLLVLPFPLHLPEQAFEALTRYVEAGGDLVSEACPGRLTPQAFAVRGELSPAARELFGVKHERLAVVREPESGARWTPRERTWGEFRDAAELTGTGWLEGLTLRPHVYLETFICRGSDPCLTVGEKVVGTVHAKGAGRAWLFGTLVGHGGTAYRDGRATTLVRTLLAQCGLAPEHQGRLLLRRRLVEGKEARLFTNPTADTVTERVSVAGWRKVSDLLDEPLTRDGDEVTLTVRPLDVRVLVLARG